jgi:hypothetical protein
MSEHDNYTDASAANLVEFERSDDPETWQDIGYRTPERLVSDAAGMTGEEGSEAPRVFIVGQNTDEHLSPTPAQDAKIDEYSNFLPHRHAYHRVMGRYPDDAEAA